MSRNENKFYGLEIITGLGSLILILINSDLDIPKLYALQFVAKVYKLEIFLSFSCVLIYLLYKHRYGLYKIFHVSGLRRGRVLALFLLVSFIAFVNSITYAPSGTASVLSTVVSSPKSIARSYWRSRRTAYSPDVIKLYRRYTYYKAAVQYLDGDEDGALRFLESMGPLEESDDYTGDPVYELKDYIASKRLYAANSFARSVRLHETPGTSLQLYLVQSANVLWPNERYKAAMEKDVAEYHQRVKTVVSILDGCLNGRVVKGALGEAEQKILLQTVPHVPELYAVGTGSEVIASCSGGHIGLEGHFSAEEKLTILRKFAGRWDGLLKIRPRPLAQLDPESNIEEFKELFR